MRLLTVVEDYVLAAMKRADGQILEDGTVAATVPDCFGVVAFGVDPHECTANLYTRLEDWVRVSLKNGYELPVIDNIDLNGDAGRILATYHDGGAAPIRGRFSENEEELEAAFDEWDRETPD